MARAMRKAIEAGYEARGAGRIPRRLYAQASSPDEGLAELAAGADAQEPAPESGSAAERAAAQAERASTRS
jgi:hypothetical protein